ncbi:MAG: tail fiber protein [Bacteroidota bacterium]
MNRTTLCTVGLCILLVSHSLAQSISQKGFSFQGYARDIDGNALASSAVSVRFSIYPEGGADAFQEVHNLNTDAFGLFQATVGSINTVSFGNLEWHKNKYFLRVEVQTGNSGFVEITNTELLSVPYAQASEKASENGVPPGSIMPFAGQKGNIPPGWLACDGTAVSSNDYPDLFAAIGTSWGDGTSGSGGEDFNVPDLRGYFLRGVNEGTGRDPDVGGRSALLPGGNTGDNTGSYQGDMYESHAHSINDPGHNHDYSDRQPNNTTRACEACVNKLNPYTSESDLGRTTGNRTTGITINASGGNETRPMNAYVWFIVKY